MPYEVKQEGDKFLVVNKNTGDTKATHDSKEKADAQVKLLHDIENGMNDGTK